MYFQSDLSGHKHMCMPIHAAELMQMRVLSQPGMHLMRDSAYLLSRRSTKFFCVGICSEEQTRPRIPLISSTSALPHVHMSIKCDFPHFLTSINSMNHFYPNF